MRFEDALPKFAFLFLIFSVVVSGYVHDILSCQMRGFLHTMYYARHFFGVLLVFVFIMLEGGWSFNEAENDAAPNNWASGNVLDTLAMSGILYTFFLLASKARLGWNVAFFILTFVVYLMNTQRSYWLVRKKITEEASQKVLKAEYAIFGVAIAVLVAGFIDYVVYQRASYGSKFSWNFFFLGKQVCKSLT